MRVFLAEYCGRVKYFIANLLAFQIKKRLTCPAMTDVFPILGKKQDEIDPVNNARADHANDAHNCTSGACTTEPHDHHHGDDASVKGVRGQTDGEGTAHDMVTDPSGLKVLTFGCRLNTYESEVMRQHAAAAGMNDVIIVNTCAVTNEAERQARQAVRRAKRDNPDAKIIVTGCAAQIHPEKFAEMAEVDRVIGNHEKLLPETWASMNDAYGEERIQVNDIMSVKETAGHLISGFDGRSRAFLQVQNGCDHRCTFCIIPYGRGNSRSVPIGEIVTQIRQVVAQGCKEVVLTGVDVTSYGHDLPGEPTLGQMMRRVLAMVPELPRMRLSSLDPAEIDEDMWYLIEHEPRLMPHLHISFQAGDDMILKRMKRRHNSQHIRDFCNKARDLRPDITFGADVIAGFPTETEEMFINTQNLIKECEISLLHVFPFSPRVGTPAARMPQNDGATIKQRASRLRMLAAKMEDQLYARWVGREAEILMEQNGTAHTEAFVPVRLKNGQTLESGELARVRLTGVHMERYLEAELL